MQMPSIAAAKPYLIGVGAAGLVLFWLLRYQKAAGGGDPWAASVEAADWFFRPGGAWEDNLALMDMGTNLGGVNLKW